MTEQKVNHTPGPWTVVGESGNPGEGEIIEASDRTVAWTADTLSRHHEDEGYVSDEDKANARLIAAAPDLLEAAREYAALLESVAEDAGDDVRLAHVQKLVAEIEGS